MQGCSPSSVHHPKHNGFWLILQNSTLSVLLHTEGHVLQHRFHVPLENMDPDLLADQTSDEIGSI